MSITANQICTNALLEGGMYAQGETPSAADLAFVLSKLNRLLDTWNSDKLYVYSTNFAQYTMISGKNPQTIGKGFAVSSVSLTSNVAQIVGVPSLPFFQVGDSVTSLNIGTIGGVNFNQTAVLVTSVSADGTTIQFALTAANVVSTPATGVIIPASTPATQAPDFPIQTTRPTKIVNAQILLNYPPQPVRVPMRIVDADWWANQRVPTIQTTLPTHLYYEPEFPNGLLYFWPVPQIAYPVELNTWTNLAQLGQFDSFNLPPGYEDAITYTLAESICPSFGRPLDGTLAAFAQKSRAMIQSLNSASPKITTADLGIPSQSSDQRGRADFNWKTGNLAG
jgi:hypothetical protein